VLFFCVELFPVFSRLSGNDEVGSRFMKMTLEMDLRIASEFSTVSGKTQLFSTPSSGTINASNLQLKKSNIN
jgi:hypothetical protein